MRHIGEGVKVVQTFVCLECGTQITAPTGTKPGFLRCAAGHRVQIVKSRPLWQIGLLSFWLSFAIASVLIHILQTVWISRFTHLIVWSILAALSVSGVYLVVQGLRCKSGRSPIDILGRQYVIIGLARLCVALALGALAAMEIVYQV